MFLAQFLSGEYSFEVAISTIDDRVQGTWRLEPAVVVKNKISLAKRTLSRVRRTSDTLHRLGPNLCLS